MIYVGENYNTNSGVLEVTSYDDNLNVGVRFLDTGYECITSSYQIYNGAVLDRMKANVYSVGILGNGVSKIDGKHTREYAVWHEMMKRCYDKKYHSKFPSYIGCVAEDFFKYFPDFTEWVVEQKGFGKAGWDFDKDLLGSGKLYSRDFCVFVPKEINYAFLRWEKKSTKELPTGVRERKGRYEAQSKNHLGELKTKFSGDFQYLADWYKDTKKGYLKFLAEKWKDQLDIRVYDLLINYEFKEND